MNVIEQQQTMTNLIKLLLSNVVKLFQGVEVVHVHMSVGAKVKVHRSKRITEWVCASP